MSTNSNYKIKNVAVSSNGRNEIYFDVEWEGDRNIDYYELRVYEEGEDSSLELYAYPDHKVRVVVKDYNFIKNWESKKVNKQTVYVAVGIYDYNDEGKLVKEEVLAKSEPIELNIYYEFHFFRKNVLELR